MASGEFETFVVCVNEEHLIGDEVQIVFTGAVSGMEFGRAILIYDVRCEPVVEFLTDMNLYSTDCGAPPSFQLFAICVNAGHTDGAAMELVVYGPDPTGGSTPVEILRVPMDWTPSCVAVLGDPSGPGLGQVMSLCAGVPKPGAR